MTFWRRPAPTTPSWSAPRAGRRSLADPLHASLEDAMKHLVRVGAMAAALLLLAGAPGSAAPAAAISALSANLTTTAIAVAGKATFAGDVVQVGTDATGDPTQKGVGADVTEASIEMAANGRD